jgi:D-glycero-D-manno-heptose 1,7-bisphosphate phosphatase
LGVDRLTVTAAAFFDRDGVVNELVPDPRSGLPESPLDPAQVSLVPGAAAGLQRLRDAGFLLVGVSNQPAAAKGTVPLDELKRVQARVLELLRAEGVEPDAFRLCFHHPDGTVPGLAGTCDCRKPAPGMLLDAARELKLDLSSSWMIGDTDADIEAGSAAGCRTILVENPASSHKRTGAVRPDLRASDLATAADLLLVFEAR